MSVTLKNTLFKNTIIRPSVPMDYIKGNNLWLDVRDSSSMRFLGSNVSYMNDKSGDNNHIQQITSSKQALYTTYNGKPALLFGGNDYYLTVKNFPALTSYTIFSVIRYNAVGAGSAILSSHSFGTSPSNKATLYKPANEEYLRIDHPPSAALYTDKIITTNPFIQTSKWTGIQTRLYVNGSLSTKALASANPIYSDIAAIGALNNSGSNPLQGHLFEFIMFDRELNDTERGIMETWLNNKHGVY